MGYTFYLSDYGPVTATVLDEGGNPITPLSGTVTIVNQQTGVEVVTNAGCITGDGTITYLVPDASPVTATSARYIAYLTAIIDATTKQTTAIPLDVLDRKSYLVVDRWRRKCEFSAPATADGSDPLSDEEGRDWIDQAVALINRYYDSGYTSTLASITPVAPANDLEFIATVASLMARTAWWAGKGDWHDDEMGISTSPFQREWNIIFAILREKSAADWFEDDGILVNDQYNRDRVVYDGVKLDSSAYWFAMPDDPPVDTDIPI